MRSERFKALIFVALVAFSACAAAVLAARRLVWNQTPSVPRGLYLRRASTGVAVGSMVVFAVPASVRSLVRERRYLPPGATLMKRVVAMPGDRVCLDGETYVVNERPIARVRIADSRGRSLPVFRFCGQVPPGRAFVATSAPLSFDSRYFGPVPLETLTVVTPLWTFSR
jgi:conjugative transfer signal peptidase TraF